MVKLCEFLPSDPTSLNNLHLMHPSAFPGQIQPLGSEFRLSQDCSRALRSRGSLFICWQRVCSHDFTGKGGATLQRDCWPQEPSSPGMDHVVPCWPMSVGWIVWFHGFGEAAGGRSSEFLQVRGVWRGDAPKKLLDTKCCHQMKPTLNCFKPSLVDEGPNSAGAPSK